MHATASPTNQQPATIEELEEKLKSTNKSLEVQKVRVAWRDLMACSAVSGYSLSTFVNQVLPTTIKLTYSGLEAGVSYATNTIPGHYVVAMASHTGTKITAISSWLTATSVYSAISTKVGHLAGVAILHGKNLSAGAMNCMKNAHVLTHVSPMHAAIFTVFVSCVAYFARHALIENFEFFENHKFTLYVLSHVISGLLVYRASEGLAYLGATTAAISVSSATVLTVAALASYLFVRKLHFPNT